mgnify:CR=1 FL=1
MKSPIIGSVAVAAAAAMAAVALAADDVTSLSYISYLERYSTVRPAQQGETLEAVVNMPIVSGDRLETSRGARVEIQLADGSTLWLDEFTVLDVDAVVGSRDDPAPRTALYLSQGSIAIEIPAVALGNEQTRLDTQFGAAFLDKPGLYRLELEDGSLHVEAHQGLAELPAGAGSSLLRAGQEGWVDGTGTVDKRPLRARYDDFWGWVEARRRAAAGTAPQHVEGRASRAAWVLSSYGEWVYLDGYGSWMWRPRVAVGWVPYAYGRWYWTPVGWTWISYEPWGWLPYHYGTWYWDVRFGWVWGWDAVWGPAWVHWFYYPGYVGWCPRGYYDGWYYRHCRDCWGQHRHDPRRWRGATLDFSGRVRLRAIDPRPWTFVTADGFTSSRLDRVRVAPERLLRELPGDAFAQVRSGPLVTPLPGRGDTGRLLERSLGVRQVELPDLSGIMGRDDTTAGRLAAVPVKPLRTAEIALPVRTGSQGSGAGVPTTRELPGVGRGVPGSPSPSGAVPRSLPGEPGRGGSGSGVVSSRPSPDTPGRGGASGSVPRATVPERPAPPVRSDPPRTVRSQPAPTGRVPVRPSSPETPQRPATPRSGPSVTTPSPPSAPTASSRGISSTFVAPFEGARTGGSVPRATTPRAVTVGEPGRAVPVPPSTRPLPPARLPESTTSRSVGAPPVPRSLGSQVAPREGSSSSHTASPRGSAPAHARPAASRPRGRE